MVTSGFFLSMLYENGDYETWLALMQERFDEMTSEENFQNIQEKHEEMSQLMEQIQEAIQNGDY